MVADPKKFYGGVGLMAGFIIVLVIMFMPIFAGKNLLDYMDSLYNSISKGSAYYVAGLQEENEIRRGIGIDVSLDLHDEEQAAGTALLLEAGGASVVQEAARLAAKGDLGAILGRCLEDSDEMFANAGSAVRDRYGYDEKRVMFNWWTALKAMDKDLKKQKRFAEAAFVISVKKKAVECAYNYYGIEPQKITERLGVVIFSLVFYVLYTVWYGFAVIFMFEGWGLKLSH
jgi:hypothetical protein